MIHLDRNNIEKIAHTPEDRLLLAKVWDKINAGIQRCIPANTAFLSPRDLYDRLQGTEVFVGMPVWVYHTSADGQFYFIQTYLPPQSFNSLICEAKW